MIVGVATNLIYSASCDSARATNAPPLRTAPRHLSPATPALLGRLYWIPTFSVLGDCVLRGYALQIRSFLAARLAQQSAAHRFSSIVELAPDWIYSASGDSARATNAPPLRIQFAFVGCHFA